MRFIASLPKDVLQLLIELVLVSRGLEVAATQTKPACADLYHNTVQLKATGKNLGF